MSEDFPQLATRSFAGPRVSFPDTLLLIRALALFWASPRKRHARFPLGFGAVLPHLLSKWASPTSLVLFPSDWPKPTY